MEPGTEAWALDLDTGSWKWVPGCWSSDVENGSKQLVQEAWIWVHHSDSDSGSWGVGAGSGTEGCDWNLKLALGPGALVPVFKIQKERTT